MKEPKEWTLMFYFASRNPLAPGVVNQLKALKNAGYHQDVNVIAHFDPEPAGTPGHIFDVNVIEKLKNPGKNRIGFAANDPFARNLMFDKLWGDEVNRQDKPIRKLIQEELAPKLAQKQVRFDPPMPPEPSERRDEEAGNVELPGPRKSLAAFLEFCAKNYPAKRYMLFILGHGMVVGDDIFLFDERAAQRSLTLKQLGKMLGSFSGSIGESKLELVSFHACSLSSVEVAVELEGTANFMLATQGPAFVGSWPYTQILIRVFNDVTEKARDKQEFTEDNVKEMVERIYEYVLHNSTDFVLAGYSFELCLCDLNRITAVKNPVQRLSEALLAGLKDPMAIHCIVLAHWRSQSYFQENYTDLYDFCFCLQRFCEQFSEATKQTELYGDIQRACDSVMHVLIEKNPEGPVVLSDFAGPDSQYSHGLSVYFPWTRPSSDKAIIREYADYKFADTEWLRFLDAYWGPEPWRERTEHSMSSESTEDSTRIELKDSTMRAAYKDETDPLRPPVESSGADQLREDMASLMFNAQGGLSQAGTLGDDSSFVNPSKTDRNDPTGDECSCGSIKNYVRDTRGRVERRRGSAKPPIPVSRPAFLRSGEVKPR